MKCETCGYDWAARIVTVFHKDGTLTKNCDRCGAGKSTVYDVYFKGPYVDEHLASDQYPGPKVINSRSEKKMWMDKCNLREAGDRVHGSNKFDPISHRHGVESLRRKGYER